MRSIVCGTKVRQISECCGVQKIICVVLCALCIFVLFCFSLVELFQSHRFCLLFTAGLLTGFRLTSDLQTTSDTNGGGTVVKSKPSSAITTDLDNSNYDGNDDDINGGGRVLRESFGASDNEYASGSSSDQGELEQSGSEAEEDSDDDSISGSDNESDSDQTANSSGVDDDENRFGSKHVSLPETATSHKIRPVDRVDENHPKKNKKRERAPTVGSSNSKHALKAAKKAYKQKKASGSTKRSQKVSKLEPNEKKERSSSGSGGRRSSSGKKRSQ